MEVFAGGPSGGGGTRIATATANQSSGSAVATACGTTGTHYRFAIAMTASMRSSHGGQKLYVYGDSPVGNANNALSGSGSFTLPPLPNTPPTLSAPSSSTSGSYTVSWTAVPEATSYVVQQQLNGGSWSQIYDGGGTSVARSGLGNGTYGYRAQSCTSGVCTGWSATVTVSVLHVPPEPASISLPATSSGTVAVSWAASSTATSYILQHAESGVSGWVTIYNGSGTSYSAHETSTGTWTYQVKACNASGCSAFRAGSSGVAVTLPPGSSPSLNVPATNTTGSYTVSWNSVGGATSYTLQEQVNGGSWSTVYSGGATSKAVSGKTNATYGYRVRACNVGGCSGWSASQSVAVTVPPQTPTTVTAVVEHRSYIDLRPPERTYLNVNWPSVA
ncbi:hypothetical protein [Oleiagrimonas sp.]|uniref:hypothetical protein n=1 Tax=Oleiagrimonas sp. TaxID=2010330 RepID=UPI00262C4267|nr:hypothetical protein [Oleiagrimonas sp.]MDA3913810.1 hypothetical protein [Oleiagrimonas sp.]